jgi:hypothetical protein
MGQLHEYDDMYEDMPERFGVTPSLMKHSDDPIQGEPVIVSLTLSTYDALNSSRINETTIKKELVDKIAKCLYNSKMIEFTKQENLATNEFIFKARIFAVPDDKVRMLRTKGVIK